MPLGNWCISYHSGAKFLSVNKSLNSPVGYLNCFSALEEAEGLEFFIQFPINLEAANQVCGQLTQSILRY